MSRIRTTRELRVARHVRVREKVAGSTDRPRLAVFRSLTHIYAQVIDDASGQTLAAASSLEPGMRESKKGKKSDVSKQVGALIAQRAKEKGVSKVVFDRGGYLYHGRVKALAEAAREGGLSF